MDYKQKSRQIYQEWFSNRSEYNRRTQELYFQYIRSPEWKAKHDERMKIDGYRCVMCGCGGTSLNPLQVHHLDYHNLYQENIDKELVTLCKACHFSVHQMMNRVTNRNTGQRGWKDSMSISMVTVSSCDGRTLDYKEQK